MNPLLWALLLLLAITGKSAYRVTLMSLFNSAGCEEITLYIFWYILIVNPDVLSQSCKEGSVVNDHFGQRRVCRGGKLGNPCRVRREWSGMLPGERSVIITPELRAKFQYDCLAQDIGISAK